MKKMFTDADSIKRLSDSGVYHYNGKKAVGRLAVRVSPGGKKTFIVHYYAKGQSKRFTLGVFPAMSLGEAKQAALDLAGTDPVAEKAQARKDKELAAELAEQKRIKQLSRRTMADLWKKYSNLTKTKQKAASTQREEARKWRVDIQPVLGDIAVKDITPAMLDGFLEKQAMRSPVAANRVYSLLHLMFRPAMAGGWITVHPLQWIDPPAKETPRKRILTDSEIRQVWPHLETTKSNAGDIMKIVLLSCQRPGEVCAMRWDDLDLDKRLWTQTNNKTDTTMLVPISDQVFDILSSRERTSKWVFPARRGVHTKDTSRARLRIQKASGTEGWTAHDLRRTGRTIMSRLEIDHHVRERVLNHAQTGVAGVYDQHDYLREKTEALRKLGNEIWKILGKEVEPAKIIQMRQAQ